MIQLVKRYVQAIGGDPQFVVHVTAMCLLDLMKHVTLSLVNAIVKPTIIGKLDIHVGNRFLIKKFSHRIY